jgi:hypothetical protein
VDGDDREAHGRGRVPAADLDGVARVLGGRGGGEPRAELGLLVLSLPRSPGRAHLRVLGGVLGPQRDRLDLAQLPLAQSGDARADPGGVTGQGRRGRARRRVGDRRDAGEPGDAERSDQRRQEYASPAVWQTANVRAIGRFRQR